MGSKGKKGTAWKKKEEDFCIWAFCLLHEAQGQPISHSLSGSLGSFAERSACCLPLLVYVLPSCAFPGGWGSCRGCWVSPVSGDQGDMRQESSKREKVGSWMCEQCRKCRLAWSLDSMTSLCGPGIDRQFLALAKPLLCRKRKGRCLEMGWQGNGMIIRDRAELPGV